MCSCSRKTERRAWWSEGLGSNRSGYVLPRNFLSSSHTTGSASPPLPSPHMCIIYTPMIHHRQHVCVCVYPSPLSPSPSLSLSLSLTHSLTRSLPVSLSAYLLYPPPFFSSLLLLPPSPPSPPFLGVMKPVCGLPLLLSRGPSRCFCYCRRSCYRGRGCGECVPGLYRR